MHSFRLSVSLPETVVVIYVNSLSERSCSSFVIEWLSPLADSHCGSQLNLGKGWNRNRTVKFSRKLDNFGIELNTLNIEAGAFQI